MSTLSTLLYINYLHTPLVSMLHRNMLKVLNMLPVSLVSIFPFDCENGAFASFFSLFFGGLAELASA